MRLILDIGSGNTLTDCETAKKIIDEVTIRDTKKHEIIFKTQLFLAAWPNKRLKKNVFEYAWSYAADKGYRLTSSVFDNISLKYLLQFDVTSCRLPFIKIACRPDLYWLIGEIPRRIQVYVSHDKKPTGSGAFALDNNTTVLHCVRKYPAEYEDYGDTFSNAISDHTVGWKLYNEALPDILEKHLCLERNPQNPDSGPFAVTPEELEGII